MRPVAIVLSLVPLLAGCAEDFCRGSDVKYYDEALAFHLTRRGVDRDG